MRQYLDLLQDVLDNGVQQSNRTGIDTIGVFGRMLKFDLSDGFPAVTTKELNFKAVAAELVGFLRGYDNAAAFRDLGTKIWDANANKNEAWLKSPYRKHKDDLGKIYGVQWRRWGTRNGGYVDQLANAVDKILSQPTDRRIIISAWNVGELHEMALPPCHILYQFIVDTKNRRLNMCMYQRSCDLFLGVPFNIASASLLLSLMARWTGYVPGTFTHFLADAHIYVNHIAQVKQQLTRAPRELPELAIGDVMDLQQALQFDSFNQEESPPSQAQRIKAAIDDVEPFDFELVGYEPHPPIKAEMAV
jgi:thymidylate synthase